MTHSNHQHPTPQQEKISAQRTTGNQANHRWLVPLLIAVTVVAISAFLLLNGSDEPEPVTPSARRAIGPESAPVTITEFADFGCITCKAWHQFGIRDQILAHYGDQVRFVWRDFPVTLPQSPRAAEAGFCAHDQGAFWAYHEILYANAPKFSDQELIAYAAEIGLDSQGFTACLESGEHRGSVERERSAALEQGLRSVPSFMVNDQRLIGPPSFEQLVTIIDELLAAME